jgi:phosphoglycolate phosphatase/AHBA synthesis associated protein
MDGVLIDSYEVWFQLMNAACAEYRVAPISRETFRECWGQGIQADIKLFFREQGVDELEAFYDDHFMDFAQHLSVNPDAGSVFAQLERREIASAVITNTPAGLARRILEHAVLGPEALVGGTDVKNAKPAPDMVLLGCELLGVHPSEAVVVGDSDFDRAAARAAGVPFAGFGIEGDVELERLIDLIALLSPARSLTAFSEAD